MKTARVMLPAFLFLAFSAGAAKAPEDFEFVVFGDSRIAAPGAPLPEAYRRILVETSLINPDLVFHTGDLVFGYGESESELRKEYEAISVFLPELESAVYFVPGNHDYHSALTIRVFKEITGQEKDYFSFEHNGVNFIMLNTELPGRAGRVVGAQFDWLKKELERGRNARALFVFMHRPLFSSPDTYKVRDEYFPRLPKSAQWKKERRALLDLLAQYPVSAVFSGHEHLYYRTEYQGIPLITLGGGGATFAAPPDKGGFFNYMIVSVTDGKIRYNLMEPYHFSVDTRTYNKQGVVYGQAIINNIHGGMERGAITLRGIRFMLPEGKYQAKAQSVVAPSQLLPSVPYLGLLEESDSVMESERMEKVRAIMVRRLKAEVHKVIPNPNDLRMVEVWVKVTAPGTFPIRLTVSPAGRQKR